MQQLPQDNLLHNIIPFIGYFNLGDFLVSLCYRSDKITSIKSKEYHRRMKCIDNPHKDILKIYTIDGGHHCISDITTSFVFIKELTWKGVILHRYDGPTVIWADGTTTWCLNNKIHRDGGPAIIEPDGGQYWYKKGLMHRDDGPAVIQMDGYQEWAINDKTHRESGPAAIHPNGKEVWYIHATLVRYPEYNYKKTYILDGLTVDIYIRPDYNKTTFFAYIIMLDKPSIGYSVDIYRVVGDVNNDIHITSVNFINETKQYGELEIIYLDKCNEQSITLNPEYGSNHDALHAYYKKINTV